MWLTGASYFRVVTIWYYTVQCIGALLLSYKWCCTVTLNTLCPVTTKRLSRYFVRIHGKFLEYVLDRLMALLFLDFLQRCRDVN